MRALALAMAMLPLTGCIAWHSKTGNQQLVKTTVVGLEVAPNPLIGPLGVVTYSVRFGMVRNEYLVNPVSTNGPVFAAPFTSNVTGNLSLVSQSATENISTK